MSQFRSTAAAIGAGVALLAAPSLAHAGPSATPRTTWDATVCKGYNLPAATAPVLAESADWDAITAGPTATWPGTTQAWITYRGLADRLRSVGAASTTVNARWWWEITRPDGTKAIEQAPYSVAETPVPETGEITLAGFPPAPKEPLAQVGTYSFALQSLGLDVSGRSASGDPVVIGNPGVGDPFTTTVTCGGIGTVGTAQTIAGSDLPPISISQAATGAATLRGASVGFVPLAGTVAGTIAQPTGAFTGAVSLIDAPAKLTALGIFPLRATFGFVESGSATGALTSTAPTLTTAQTITLKSLTFLGTKLSLGTTCSSAAPVALALTGSSYSPSAGGSFTGRFRMPAFAGCGSSLALVRNLLTGTNATVSLALRPTAAPTPTPLPTPLPAA